MPIDHPRPTFINIENPNDAKGASKRHAVRSHAARYQWKKHFEGKSGKSLPYRRRRREEFLPLRIELDCSLLQQDRETGADGEESDDLRLSPPAPPIFKILGGGRVDPFRTYPIAWNPFIPVIVDHCKFIGFHLSSNSLSMCDIYKRMNLLTPTRSGQHGR